MPKSYESIALWAKSCGLQVHAGVGLPEVVETSGCFSAKQRSLVAHELRSGKPVSDAFTHLVPSLSYADASLLEASKRTGSLEKGFEVLSNQYFIRTRAQSDLLAAFIYPIGILCIGVFLMNVQAVLYKEVQIRDASIQFVVSLLIGFAGIYLLKKIILMRPPLLHLLIRSFPPFRGLSKLLAVQRSVWVFQQASVAALPVSEMFNLAADAGHFSAISKRAEQFQREVSLGADFQQSFKKFLRAYPGFARRGIAVFSPYDLPAWAQQIQVQLSERGSKSAESICSIAKPVALVICSPAIFLILQELWLTMGRELSERFSQLF